MMQVTDEMVNAALKVYNAEYDDRFAHLVTKGRQAREFAMAKALDAAFALATTTPPTGSADGNIEPRPQDGRRLENRVAALEETVAAINSDKNFIRQAINFHVERYNGQLADLAQQVQALRDDMLRVKNEGVALLKADVAHLRRQLQDMDMHCHNHSHVLTPAVSGRTGMPVFVFVDTNPEADYITDTRDFDDADVPTQPEPAADAGDEAKLTGRNALDWADVAEAVDAMCPASVEYSDLVDMAEAAVNKAAELGIIPRPLDPADADLLDVISEAMDHHPDYIHKHRDARPVAEAIAAYQKGGDR